MQRRKKFYVALAIYAVLGLLIWTMMVDVPLPVGNGHIGIRSLTLIVLALFAVRTMLHWRAEQIRSEQEDEQSFELM
jgi:heme A synthase